MEKIKDMIYRQDVIDALDEIESEVADGDGFQYEKWRKHFCEMTSARPDHIADDNKKGDVIYRQDAIDALMKKDKKLRNINWYDKPYAEGECREIDEALSIISNLPSAQSEQTCVNCGRTANNGGWYADGRTRCPIEEHYALPKDGFCHLWEKRNITDDDYPERMEE